jgi:uncharacterized protein with PQ loop repeat
MITILGWIAALISVILWLPQTIKAIQCARTNQPVAGVSLGTLTLGLVNGVIWLVWSILANELAVGAPGLVGIPCLLLTMYLVITRKPGNNT